MHKEIRCDWNTICEYGKQPPMRPSLMESLISWQRRPLSLEKRQKLQPSCLNSSGEKLDCTCRIHVAINEHFILPTLQFCLHNSDLVRLSYPSKTLPNYAIVTCLATPAYYVLLLFFLQNLSIHIFSKLLWRWRSPTLNKPVTETWRSLLKIRTLMNLLLSAKYYVVNWDHGGLT